MVRLILLLMLCMSALAHAEQIPDPGKWREVTDRDGIKVYMAHTDASRIKTFRGVTVMDIDDFRSIGAIMDDYDFVASWLHMVSEIKDLGRKSPYDRHVYITTHLPWPVSDRDAALWVGLQQDPKTYAVKMPFHNVPGLVAEKPDFVRIPTMQGFFLWEPLKPGKVRMTFQVLLDPGGYIPAWLSNLILRDIPYFSMKQLRRVINLKKYQGVDTGYYKVPPGWPHASDDTGGKAAAAH